MKPRRTTRARWMDVSVTLRSGLVHWPGDPPLSITRTKDLAHGDSCTVSRLSLGSHTGTHMDAPLHFLRGGRGLDRMPLEAVLGPARVIAIFDAHVITPEELAAHRIQRGERVLFKTRNSPRCWRQPTFIEDFVYLSTAAARWLAARRVQTVGVDYLSVGGYREGNGVAVHRTLLAAGIWIIEGLDLSRARPGRYELACLPLKILDSDGAPARAVLRPLTTH